MAKSELNRADRFYQNPVLRDGEWDRAKQAPWWLTTIVLAIVAIAFYSGIYSSTGPNLTGWIIGLVMIAIYFILGRLRRPWARQQLRQLHGQAS